jgi:ABC-type nitrate/sulfonate/bicarbonate transport system permease component
MTVGRLPARYRLSPGRVRLLQVTGVLAFLLFWQIFGAERPEWYSQPTRVIAEMGRLVTADRVVQFIDGSFWVLAAKSLGALLVGLVLSFVAGLTAGFLIGRYRLFQVALDPYMAAVYSVPRVAFVPIMVIWFGISATMEVWGVGIPLSRFVIASVVVASAVLIAFSTAAGVREMMREYSEVARAFNLMAVKSRNEEWIVAAVLGAVVIGAAAGWVSIVQAIIATFVAVAVLVVRDRHLFLKILLPGAVPFLATGLRLAIQRGLVAVIVAEFLIGVPGLGFVIRASRAGGLTDRMFAMAIFLMVLGVLIIALTKRIETRLSAWRPKAF